MLSSFLKVNLNHRRILMNNWSPTNYLGSYPPASRTLHERLHGASGYPLRRAHYTSVSGGQNTPSMATATHGKRQVPEIRRGAWSIVTLFTGSHIAIKSPPSKIPGSLASALSDTVFRARFAFLLVAVQGHDLAQIALQAKPLYLFGKTTPQ